MVSGVLTSPPPEDGTLGAATEGPGDAHSLGKFAALRLLLRRHSDQLVTSKSMPSNV